MKKSITSFLLAVIFVLQAKAQVVLYEPFNAPFNPTTAGWDVQNLSSPIGTASWFQGNSFNALVGGATDYFAVNFNSTAGTGTNNTISNWLITPTLNLVNGAIIQFATRTTANSNFADRLQVYYSTAGNGTNVGTTAGTATNTAGTFTNIVFDLNSGQNAMGYPGFWIAMTVSLSGITTPTVGRIALRYYLTNAGAAGANGNYIGIDEFRYSLPCNHAPAFASWNNQLCQGNPVSLQVSGSGTTAITSYSWMNGATTNTTTYIPQNSGMNSCYVLLETTPGCEYLEVANLNVLPTPTVSFSRVPSGHICSGTNVTVTASGANSYTYELSPTQSSTMNPLGITLPTVNALSNATFVIKGRGNNNCVHTRTISLPVDPNPTVTVTGPTSPLCIGKTATLGATGALTYSWSGTSTSTMVPLTYSATAPAGVKNFSMVGTSIEGCVSTPVVLTLTVNNCTGIEELSAGYTVNAYPSPFSDQLYIKDFSGSVKLINESGQSVAELQYTAAEKIDTSKLPAGVYLLQMTNTSGQHFYKKLVKQ